MAYLGVVYSATRHKVSALTEKLLLVEHES